MTFYAKQKLYFVNSIPSWIPRTMKLLFFTQFFLARSFCFIEIDSFDTRRRAILLRLKGIEFANIYIYIIEYNEK